MFASVRRYLLEPALIDALGDCAPEVATLLAGLPGCSGGHLIRTRDGLIVVLFGNDEQAAAYVGTRFVAWVHRRVPGLRGALPPEVWAGDVLVRVRPAGPESWREGAGTKALTLAVPDTGGGPTSGMGTAEGEDS
jgi:hypothetical protein